MFRLKFYAAMFALVIGLLTAFTQTARVTASSSAQQIEESAAKESNYQALASQASFPGTGVGAIPDGTSNETYGAPRVVSFAVAGLALGITDVSVDFTGTHTWVGDLDVVLTAPGGSASVVLFSRMGYRETTPFGNPAHLNGTYRFSDGAATNFYHAAATSQVPQPIPSGNYRTTETSPDVFQATTKLTLNFKSLSPAQANGTWTLTFRDHTQGNTGTITAANLAVISGEPPVLPGFQGTGVGAVPDSPYSPSPNAPYNETYGEPLIVSFPVTGITGNISDVSVYINGFHSHIGDLDVVLASPGGSRSQVIFSRVGFHRYSINWPEWSENANLDGTYHFSDSATANFWEAARVTRFDDPIPPGSYRTTEAGATYQQNNPAPATSLTANFAGLSPAEINGTWTLTFHDASNLNNHAIITAAGLSITAVAPPPPNLIQDPGFERSSFLGTNNFWTSTSTNSTSSLCNFTRCGTPVAAGRPRSQSGWVWFDQYPRGGANNLGEIGTVQQRVVFPNGGNLTLSYYLHRVVQSPATSTLKVSVDGTVMQTITEPSVSDPGYIKQTVDLSRFTDGAPHTILFTYNRPATDVVNDNFLMDDVTLVPVGANTISINGMVSYGNILAGQSAKMVPNVSFNAVGNQYSSATTNGNGIYTLYNLTNGADYVVTPTKSGQINGITPFDATLVLRCVAAGANCTLTDNQKLAANANGDNSITPFDATLILRFVAANAQTMATGQVGNWKFNPAMISYSALSSSLSSQNHEAILIGEVNGSWNSSASIAENNTDEETQKNAVAFDPSSTDSTIEALGEPLENEISTQDSPDSINNQVEISLPDNVESSEDGFVRIPIGFQNKTGKQISSYRFAVRFNPFVLQPDEAGFEKGDGQSEGFAIVSDRATPGKIGIAGAAFGNDVLAPGTLLYLRFRIVETKYDSPLVRAATRLIFDQTSPNAIMFEDNLGSRAAVVTSNGVLRVNENKLLGGK